MKKILILGATGSIGRQTLEIIDANPLDFKLIGVSGFNNTSLLIEIIRKYELSIASVKDSIQAEKIKKINPNIKILIGEQGLIDFAGFNPEEDITLINALVGMVGLKPTLRAIGINRNVLLANKETLVVGGHLIKEALKKSSSNLYPIDSEHSAIWQLLNGENKSSVKRLIITASGGSFRDKARTELEDVSLESALNHPNWSMGSKITIDSATMINKGFEIIEAVYLFDLGIDKVEAILHQESLIHSFVEFEDGSITAQIAEHDMRLPIHYAMYYPERKESIAYKLDFMKLNNLHFKKIDFNRYPCLSYAIEAYKIGGSMRTVLNAANEIAVRLFIEKKIKFLDIERIIKEEMEHHQVITFPSLEEIYTIDSEIKTRIYNQY
ncbi:MAG: 1-deoxy-D-xylulose-5-phosphate reductoisomerase [Candidatus Izemoplasmatales bacterium]|jgi:1-deoxy-D-xylulose-5-phosphate reductoisomerase|nr:1-deoxy-D-xylulose-5-phosphate reductoisomerase [Candidatus Izemoplasmatales bacterium]